MLLALVGVTGVGKSYFVDKISSALNFKKVNTIRTRAPRDNENPKFFMSQEKLDEMYKNGKLAYKFSVFDGEYGYLKDEIFSEDNYIFEMHWTTIYDWKKIRPDIKTIYIMPPTLEIAKEKTIERHLPKDKELERLNEIDEHYKAFNENENLKKEFDYIFYNNYDEESERRLIELVKNL